MKYKTSNFCIHKLRWNKDEKDKEIYLIHSFQKKNYY